MFVFIAATSYSLKYIYLRVYLLLSDLVALHPFVKASVLFCVIYAGHIDVSVVLLHASSVICKNYILLYCLCILVYFQCLHMLESHVDFPTLLGRLCCCFVCVCREYERSV
jgi:hypothetical protein